jgi:outer membrane protein assembly factor BamD
MSLRILVLALAAMLALSTACTNKKVSNPLAKVDSKQPDKVLFDRGMEAMKHNHFDIARLDMQTLINTYPESEYIARAKLALADSWYAEGGSAGWAQAEQEYSDFITFFPNMPEAAEAQLKIANIHFSQMEKPDRDFTHAVRAEEEYRKVILQYPDNEKMVAEAKAKLLQVQEVIAEREFRVGHFYYLKPAYPAAIARLQSLVDRYPLYSKADESLYYIGQSYEGEIANVKHASEIERRLRDQGKVTDAQFKKDELAREQLITHFIDEAAQAYSKILTRYPVMARSDDAKARLLALKQPVPRPTKAMLAQNKAEEDARKQQGTMSDVMGAFGRHPDVSAAARVGDPTLQDPEPVSPTGVMREMMRAAGTKPSSGTESVSAKTVETDVPGENQPAPRSDTPPADASTANADHAEAPAQQQAAQSGANDLRSSTTNSDQQTAQANDPNELKPNVAQDPAPAQAPAQVNELQGGDSQQTATNGNSAAAASSPSGQEPADDSAIASSKHKKKKGLHKIIPLK